MVPAPDAAPWRSVEGGVVLSARLTPRAGRDAIEGVGTLGEGRRVLIARVRAAAEEGKANEAARRLLAKAAGVAPSQVHLMSGATARLKVFRIAGEPSAIAAALARAAGGPR
jgi:uncharacterized protein YggU (UPF0235/DUF167 family)